MLLSIASPLRFARFGGLSSVFSISAESCVVSGLAFAASFCGSALPAEVSLPEAVETFSLLLQNASSG